jgi:hypothetical protein
MLILKRKSNQVLSKLLGDQLIHMEVEDSPLKWYGSAPTELFEQKMTKR